MSSMDSPVLARILRVAGMGPVSMISGSEPVTAKAWNRARGVRPRAPAFSSLMISAADAPSVSGEELPAVIDQAISGYFSAKNGSSKEGFNAASRSGVVDGLTVSSTVWAEPSGRATGTMSRSKLPAAA
jgi:hypothetical protein